MRLHSVYISNFKNLVDFRVDFSPDSPVSVLVGRNGTGKSNLLEALTIIFRDLDLSQPPAFEYELRYEIRGSLVELLARRGSRGIRVTCKVDGSGLPLSKFSGSAGAGLRPSYVFGYYSGPSNRLEEHFSTHQERFYRDLVRGRERPLRRLFYARNVHSNFVLLAFFLEQDPLVHQFLREHLGIEDLDSVLFVMQEPSWSSQSGDARFWNARGTVQDLLDRLYRLSLAPMRLERRAPAGLGRTSRTQQLFLYLPGLDEAKALASHYSSNQEFFKALESTYISELISDVRIRVSSRRVKSSLTFRELSEGEQQLLLVLGLMRFTREDESLFLLDEPDTHLNPSWSVQYRTFLEHFGALDQGCHVLMATHDPLVVAGLEKSEVRILERKNDGKVEALEPLEDPKGMGVGSLLTSDVYGLRSQLDLETLADLDRKRELAAKGTLSAAEAEELASLAVRLSRLGLLTENRDPEFEEYLRAKMRIKRPSKVSFSQDEIKSQREVAESLVRDILSDTPDRDRAGPPE